MEFTPIILIHALAAAGALVIAGLFALLPGNLAWHAAGLI